MTKLFFFTIAMFLTSCATTCDKLIVEKERKSCYNKINDQQREFWIDRDFNRMR